MKIASVADFRAALLHGPYAWPGGYPVYFLMKDGEPLSFKAAEQETALIIECMTDNMDDRQWIPVAVMINWEEPDLMCSHLNIPIESAYGDPKSAGDIEKLRQDVIDAAKRAFDEEFDSDLVGDIANAVALLRAAEEAGATA